MHILALVIALVSALRMPGPLSTRIASYRIDAKLDEQKRQVQGNETFTWRNDTKSRPSVLVLHLYMNAFKNDASTFFREQTTHDSPAAPEHMWGAIDVRDVVVHRAGMNLPGRLDVPRDGDQTLATLTLDRPAEPGETITVSLAFTTKLPEIVARAGVHEGFYAVAQWYPSIGVYECDPTCGWNATQYHAMSEFYADFGTYDVTLDLPSSMDVGATGVRTSAEAQGVRQLVTYHAEDVHDFVFTADARFVEHATDVDDGSGLAPVHVVLLGEPGLEANVARHLAAASAGLKELGARLGYYPYTQLTIVQVPRGAEEAGGMEYSTLFFTDDPPDPSWVYDTELVTAHELTHQWFQGMLASDEAHAAWLDEGLTELATSWVLARLSPPTALIYAFAGHHLTYVDNERAAMQRDDLDAIDTPSFEFSTNGAYATQTYRKTGLLLAALERRLGSDEFARRMRRYADANRFGHPRRADFVAQFADTPVHGLLDDALSRAGTFDYAIVRVSTEAAFATEGLIDADAGVREVRDPQRTGVHHNAILVERVGDYKLPVSVRAHCEDGSERDLPLEMGDRRWERLTFDSPSPLVEARLYPTDDTLLDVNRLNDGLRIDPDPAPRRSLITSLELILALALAWIAR